MRITLKKGFNTLPQDWIDSLPQWGSCDTAISQIMMWNNVRCKRACAIDYLTMIGFDEPEELEQKSDDWLTSTMLWIALLDCRENQTTEWYLEE